MGPKPVPCEGLFQSRHCIVTCPEPLLPTVMGFTNFGSTVGGCGWDGWKDFRVDFGLNVKSKP